MKNKFKLAGIDFDNCCANVWLKRQNREIILSIDIYFKTDNDDIDFELCKGRLYHANGFNTHIKNLKDLIGAKFIWNRCENDEGVEAGYFCVLEHESVTSGIIEVIDITENTIYMKWVGTANIYWDETFGANVPFETEFTAPIKLNPMKHVLLPLISTKMAIDENTDIEVLNFPEFLSAMKVVSEECSWSNMDVPLNLEITHKGNKYKGYVDMAYGIRENWKLCLDKNCPVNISFENIGWNLKAEFMELYFIVE